MPPHSLQTEWLAHIVFLSQLSSCSVRYGNMQDSIAHNHELADHTSRVPWLCDELNFTLPAAAGHASAYRRNIAAEKKALAKNIWYLCRIRATQSLFHAMEIQLVCARLLTETFNVFW